MDRINQYQKIVKEVLQRHKDINVKSDVTEYERQLVTDDTNGHYYVMNIGWDGTKRIHGCTIHIDVKGDKIWIQQDWTDVGVANELVEIGVPKEDIVLAFHAPYKRPFTGFAVA